jgi:hypothetical protein
VSQKAVSLSAADIQVIFSDIETISNFNSMLYSTLSQNKVYIHGTIGAVFLQLVSLLDRLRISTFFIFLFPSHSSSSPFLHLSFSFPSPLNGYHVISFHVISFRSSFLLGTLLEDVYNLREQLLCSTYYTWQLSKDLQIF